MHLKIKPGSLYLFLEFSSALLFSMIFTVDMVYHVTVVGLSPLQLVLVGTILEVSAFVFEIPTGVLADIKSRRLSVVIGYVLMGCAFLIEGSLPAFGPIALAQVLWGLGYTFTSGATQAWIADELGNEQAGQAFMRGAQAARAGGLIAIPFSVVLGTVAVALPIQLAGGALVLLGGFLALTRSEAHFKPAPAGDRSPWRMALRTVGDARRMTRRQPALLSLLGIMLLYGLYSEGFDRLWTAHLLKDFAIPWLERLEPVVWFGIIRAVSHVASLLATEVVRRRVDTGSGAQLGRALQIAAVLISVTMVGFGLVRGFWLALVLYWLISLFRSVSSPLYQAWFNNQIDDSQVRATMFSVSSQVNAIGQVAGGPAVGAIGNHSIRAALVTSAVVLLPVLPLYGRAIRRSGERQPAGAVAGE